MKLIVACDPNGGIGYENRLPWSKIEGDLPRFKRLTENHCVLMGRYTWESLPVKPLPNRINFVVTSQTTDMPYGAVPIGIPNKGQLNKYPNIWLIGGASLIKGMWHEITEVHLTKTHAEYTCDCFIDLIYLQNNFVMVSEEKHSDHDYQIWKRK